MSNSIEIHAIKVTQPYGEFFQTVMSAESAPLTTPVRPYHPR